MIVSIGNGSDAKWRCAKWAYTIIDQVLEALAGPEVYVSMRRSETGKRLWE